MPDAGLAANAPALAAFHRAASQWENVFDDPVTVNINASMTAFGSFSTVGGAEPIFLHGTYTEVRDALVVDAAAEVDDGIVAHLPNAGGFGVLMPALYSWSGEVIATKANLKAMGFVGLDGIFGFSDATIEFNSLFSFDYDNSNGVGLGLMDFESVAAHEIGHALGFISAVDLIDFAMDQGLTASAEVAPLDFFRFESGSSPSNGTQFSMATRNLEPGTPAVISDAEGDDVALSTGLFNGDGRQASHWKDNFLTGQLLGLMDPSITFGTMLEMSDADIRALDLIGWDYVIPEPASAVLLLFGLGGLGLCGKHRSIA